MSKQPDFNEYTAVVVNALNQKKKVEVSPNLGITKNAIQPKQPIKAPTQEMVAKSKNVSTIDNTNSYTKPTVLAPQKNEFIENGNPYADVFVKRDKDIEYRLDKGDLDVGRLKEMPKAISANFNATQTDVSADKEFYIAGQKTTVQNTPVFKEDYASAKQNVKALEDSYGDFNNMPPQDQIKYRSYVEKAKKNDESFVQSKEDGKKDLVDIGLARQKRQLEFNEKYKDYDVSNFLKISTDVSGAVIDQIPMMAVGALTGGYGAIPFMALKVHADASSEAYTDFYNEFGKDALVSKDVERQVENYALIKTAIEVGTEALVGGIYGTKGIFDVFEKPIKEVILTVSKSALASEFSTIAYQVLGEGAEEFVAEYMGHIMSQFTYKGKDERSSDELFKDAVYSALVAGLSSGVSQVLRYADVKTSVIRATMEMDKMSRLGIEEQQAFFKKKTGKEFKMVEQSELGNESADGSYDPSTNIISISKNVKNPFAVALVHEFTHSLQVKNLYEEYEGKVRDFIDKTQQGGFEASVNRVMDFYASKGKIISKLEANDEVVSFFTQMNMFMYSPDGITNEMSISSIEKALTGKASFSWHIQDFIQQKALGDDYGYFKELKDTFEKVVGNVKAKEAELDLENAQRKTLGLQPLSKDFVSEEFKLAPYDQTGKKITRDEKIFFRDTKIQDLDVLKPVGVEIDGEVQKGYLLAKHPLSRSNRGFNKLFAEVTQDMPDVLLETLTKEQAQKILSRLPLGFDAVPYNNGQNFVVRDAFLQFREFGHDFTKEKKRGQDDRLSLNALRKAGLTKAELGDMYGSVLRMFNVSTLIKEFEKNKNTSFISRQLDYYRNNDVDRDRILKKIEDYANEVVQTYQYGINVDSAGNSVSKEQVEGFKEISPLLKTNDGKIITLYHGDTNSFDSFDYNKMGEQGNLYSYGFYATPSFGFSMDYMDNDSPNPISLELYYNLKNPIIDDEKNISKEDFVKITDTFKTNYIFYIKALKSDAKEIKEISDQFIAESWRLDELGIAEGKSSYPDIDKISDLSDEFIRRMQKTFSSRNTNLTNKSVILPMFYNAVKEVTGKDGYVLNYDGKMHIAVAWFKNQVKSIDNKNPDFNSDNFFDTYAKKEFVMADTAEIIDDLETEVESFDDFNSFAKNVMQNWKGIPKKYDAVINKNTGYPDWGLMRDIFEQSKLRKTAKDVDRYTPKKAVENFENSPIYSSLVIDWGSYQDSDSKIDVYDEIINDKVLRDSFLSIMYDNYLTLNGKNSTELSFEDFLNMKVNLFRGQPIGKKLVEQDRFVSYTFDLNTAMDFASFDAGNADVSKSVDKISIRPIDTFGSFSSISQETANFNEFEVMVPRTILRDVSENLKYSLRNLGEHPFYQTVYQYTTDFYTKNQNYFRRVELVDRYTVDKFVKKEDESPILRDAEFNKFRQSRENDGITSLDRIISMFKYYNKPSDNVFTTYKNSLRALAHIRDMYDVVENKIYPFLPDYNLEKSRPSTNSVSMYIKIDKKYFNEVLDFVDTIDNSYIYSDQKESFYKDDMITLRISDHYNINNNFGSDRVDFSINVFDMGVKPITDYQRRFNTNLKQGGIGEEYFRLMRPKKLSIPDTGSSVPILDSKNKKVVSEMANWAKNSKAYDKNGKLLRVYHGTFFDFDEFDMSKIANDGAVGRGIYVTTNKKEALTNYTGTSGDTSSKYVRYAKSLMEQGMEEELAYKTAEEQFNEGRLIDAYINAENPVIVANPDSGENTIFFGRSFGEELYKEGMTEEEFTDVIDELLSDVFISVEGDLNSRGIFMTNEYEGTMMVSAIANAYYEGGKTFFDLGMEIMNYAYKDGQGYDATPEVVRTIAEALGYDSILDKTYSSPTFESDTKFIYDSNLGHTRPIKSDHWVVFNPNQIKYVSNPNPTSSNDMRLQIQMTEEEINGIDKALVEKFGTTENFNHTGYMMRDGRYLNMPVQAGGNSDLRAERLRHDVVESIVEQGQYQLNGAIRIRPEGNIVQIMVKPTPEQRAKLPEMLMNFKGNSTLRMGDKNSVYISLWDWKNPKMWYSTPDLTEKVFALGNIQEMLNFIDGYYEGKVKLYESPFAEFKDKMMLVAKPTDTDDIEVVESGEKLIPTLDLFNHYEDADKTIRIKVDKMNVDSALFFAKTYYKAPTEGEKNQANRILEKHRIAPTEAEIASAKVLLTKDEVQIFANHIVKGGFTATSKKTILKAIGWHEGEDLKPNEAFDGKTYVAVRHIYEGTDFDVSNPDLGYLKEILEKAYSNIRFNDEFVGAWVEDGKLYVDISVGINQGRGSHADRIAKIIGDQIIGIGGVGEQTIFNMTTGQFPRLKANINKDSFLANVVSQSYIDSPEYILEKAKEFGIKTDTRQHALTATRAGLETRTTKRVEKMIEDGEFEYTVHTDKEALAYAYESINLNLSDDREVQVQTLTKAKDNFLALVDSGVRLNKNHIAVGEVLIRELSRLNQAKASSDLIGVVAMLGTELGQSVQAMSLISRLSPAGQIVALRRVVERMRKASLESKNKFPKIEFDEYIESLIMRETDQEEIDNLFEIYKDKIASQLPVTLMDKLNAWRYLSMLGNPRTHMRNVLGNATFTPMIMLKEIVGTVLESQFVDQSARTKSILNLKTDKALIEFAKRDAKENLEKMLTDGKYSNKSDLYFRRKIFKPEILEKTRLANFKLLEIEDTIFKSMHYTRNLAQFIKARGYDLTKMTIPQLQEARAFALQEAQKATFNDASEMATVLSQMVKKGGVRAFLIEAIIPFKKTPINIVKRAFEYSPAMLVSALTYDLARVSKGDITTTEYVDKISSGLSGTALTALGALLYSLGIFNAGKDEEESDKKNEFDRSLGEQNYSINAFGKSYTLDWLTPAVMPLAIGAELQKMLMTYEKGDSLFNYGSEALISIFDPIFEMTMLQGLANSLSSYSQGVGRISDILAQASANYANQFIPTLAGQIARSLDDTRRSTFASKDSVNPFVESTLRKMANKIPFASMLNEPYINIKGEEQKNAGENIMTRLLLNMFSAGFYTEKDVNRQDKEILRLYEATKDNDAIPKTVPTKFTSNEVEYTLTGKEYTKYSETLGKTSYDMVGMLISDKKYSRMATDMKLKVFADVYKYANEKAKIEYMRGIGVAYESTTYSKPSLAEKNGISVINYLVVKQEFDTIKSDENMSKKEKFVEYLNSVGLGSKISLYLEFVGEYKDTEWEGTESVKETSTPVTKTQETNSGSVISFKDMLKK